MLPKVYALCIMGVYLNSPAAGSKFRIQVDVFQQFGTVESFFLTSNQPDLQHPS